MATPALAGTHAFITGGGSGIGLGAARAFVADGASVTLCGRTESKLADAAAELEKLHSGSARIAVADVADEAALATAMDEANAHAPLGIVIANAGMGSAGPFLGTDLEAWNQVLATNLTGVMSTFKLGGAHLAANGGGTMCAVSSIAGSHTHRFMTAYTASKAGVNMIVANAADELGSLGIRVNAVAPGLVETEISELLRGDGAVLEDYGDNMPLGRVGTTADTGAAIRFLCGPESSWITGVVLPVDGGHHLRRGPRIDALLAPFVPDLPAPSASNMPTTGNPSAEGAES